MNDLIAQMTGKSRSVREDVPLVPGAPRAKSTRERTRPDIHRRTAAAMLGLGEAAADDDDEAIIPADAEEVQNLTGPSGIRLDDEPSEKDKEPDEPDHPTSIPGGEEDQLLSPRDALVAPDVTPQALEPLDASDVPQAPQAGTPPKFVPSQQQMRPSDVNPMDVLLGRTSNRPARPEAPPENVVTAESAQATVNTLLNAGGGGGDALLKPKQPMPDPVPGRSDKIMEAFDRYGPARSWNF